MSTIHRYDHHLCNKHAEYIWEIYSIDESRLVFELRCEEHIQNWMTTRHRINSHYGQKIILKMVEEVHNS